MYNIFHDKSHEVYYPLYHRYDLIIILKLLFHNSRKIEGFPLYIVRAFVLLPICRHFSQHDLIGTGNIFSISRIVERQQILLVTLYDNLDSHDSAYSVHPSRVRGFHGHRWIQTMRNPTPNENPHAHPVRPIYVDPADWIAAVRQS